MNNGNFTQSNISIGKHCSYVSSLRFLVPFKFVYLQDWNFKNKPSSGLTWDLSDDESDNLPLLLQKNDAQLLSIKTKLEGVLIGHKVNVVINRKKTRILGIVLP